MKFIVCIFARGDSKGVPGKNIKYICGKPLIAWAIEQAVRVKNIEKVYVSTDSVEISEVARNYGAEIPFIRPKKLAADDAPEWLAWQHMVNYLYENNYDPDDVMISLPPTSPLRSIEDIESCIDLYLAGNCDVALTITESSRSPYFNMVKFNKSRGIELLMPSERDISRRQDAPQSFDIATAAYVSSLKFIKNSKSIFEGRVSGSILSSENGLDIDTPLDFKLAEFLLSERLK